MKNRVVSARLHVHATFTSPEPNPVFVVAVEVIEGTPTVGHFVNIPLNSTLTMTVRILAVAPVANDFGVELIGLILNCNDDSGRQLIDAFNICDENLDITEAGED